MQEQRVQVRAKRRGDDEGLKEIIGDPLVTRIPETEVVYWNYLAKRLDLGFVTTINLARSVLTEFTAAAPWDNPAVSSRWQWLRPKTILKKDPETGKMVPTGYAQFNVRIPVSEREVLLNLIKKLKEDGHNVGVSSFLLTAVHWATHYRYPRSGTIQPAPLPYTPANFTDEAGLIELPAMHINEARARKALAALGDTGTVTTAELPNRLRSALAG